ncbi:MAG: cytochrome c3 family protein [Vicinamibacterales bacterium]
MAHIFGPASTSVARVTLGALVVLVLLAIGLLLVRQRTPWVTNENVVIDQPIQFSHERHVAGNGIDCRYCHQSVERSSFAGIPPTRTCMSCHNEVFADSAYLAPVRTSWRTGRPLVWNRVHDLPDFVFFNHSAHVSHGVGCATCHGRVDRMPLVRRTAPLTMQWCLDCHNAPERYVRPRAAVFDMDYQPPADQLALGRRLVREYGIRRLVDCYTCHR